MRATTAVLTCAAPWQRVATGDQTVAVAERAALGTTARVAVWPPEGVGPACAAVDEVVAALDHQASRFREDSELSWLHAAGGGVFMLSDGLAEAVGVRLDLGATAKGVGSDRAVRAVMSATGHAGGVLVSLGGDIAVAGTPPRDGWPVTVAEAPNQAASGQSQLVRLPGGAVATSSVTCRRWRRDGVMLHHIVDPHTGRPADGPWRTVSVAAATCADANAAATAAIVAGRRAVSWLTREGLPARLVGRDAEIRFLGGWPTVSGRPVLVPPGSHVYAGARPAAGAR